MRTQLKDLVKFMRKMMKYTNYALYTDYQKTIDNKEHNLFVC